MPLFHATKMPPLFGVAAPAVIARDPEPAVVSPLDIPDLWSWANMDAQPEVDGTDVATLVDQSGNARHWQVVWDNGETIMRRNAIGAHAAIEFSPYTYEDFPLYTAFYAGTAPADIATYLCVYVQPVSTAGEARRVMQGDNNWLLGPYDNYYQHYAGAGFLTGPQVVPGGVAVETVRAHNLGQLGAPPLWRNWLYHNSVAVSCAQSAPDSHGGFLYLGYWGGYYEEGFPDGLLAEVIIYNRALTFWELFRLQRYLSEKYGTARQLVYADNMESYAASDPANGKRGYFGLPWNDKAWVARANA